LIGSSFGTAIKAACHLLSNRETVHVEGLV
jgi:hypothetical protein